MNVSQESLRHLIISFSPGSEAEKPLTFSMHQIFEAERIDILSASMK